MQIVDSLSGSNPSKYVLNYDPDENAEGITLVQLRNALWKVVKGKDKNLIIGSVTPEWLDTFSIDRWEFNEKTGVIGPLLGAADE